MKEELVMLRISPNRRHFLVAAGAAVVAPALGRGQGQAPAAAGDLQLGMASYTFRKFPREQALAMTKRLGLKRIAFKSMHLPLETGADEIKAVAAKVREQGLELYGCGVVYMKSEAEVRQAFDYARAAGMGIIIGVPNHELLDLVEAKVKEYDIRLAVHNHGPDDKLYPTPESVLEKIRNRDRRLGLCMDAGHTQRSGIDPSQAARKAADRLFDIHIKDVSKPTAEGTTLEIGRGIIDIPGLLRTLRKMKYSGTVALEYEKDEDDPLAGAAESIGYLRGTLTTLGAKTG